ncbi:MAG: hypothetical protein PSV36_16425 [Algoriphagus sp.]|jgi:hypothetical protein|nr:hypothetical protein [Algoriphagus sp.]
MAKKKKKEEDPKVHEELKGFKMEINSFGEISSSFSIDKINEFLNKNVEDKKLKDREGMKSDDEKDS